MNKEIRGKLWVIHFCVKVIYPKFNFYTFMIFLLIKYRIWLEKKSRGVRDMEPFEVKSFPPHLIHNLIKNNLEENFILLKNKCVVISKEQYIQLAVENLFYWDNGVLWLALKLSPEFKNKYKRKVNSRKKDDTRFKFDFVTSEIQKKLWNANKLTDLEHVRIVPVIGSNLVLKNVVLMTENEFHNITSAFGLRNIESCEIILNAIPSFACSPKIAATAEVSLVINEHDLANTFTKEVLSNYFETPKLVCLNDIFSIELHPKITAKYHYKYLDLVESIGKLYFKCSKVTSEIEQLHPLSKKSEIVQPFFIIKGVTQLTLGESIHVMKPRDQFFESRHSTCLQQCPSGLKEKFYQIQETLNPFLNGQISKSYF